jgi:hypothetical protein
MKPVFLLFIHTIFLWAGWQEYTSLEGRFRILAPGEMTQKVDTVSTEVGTLAYRTVFHQSPAKDADNLFYMVSYCDYPEGTFPADSSALLEEFFATTIEAAAASVDGEMIYTTDIQLKDHPGKFWRINYLDGKAVIKTKAYMVGDRYYAVQVISYKEGNINAAADRFFDSFHLL